MLFDLPRAKTAVELMLVLVETDVAISYPAIALRKRKSIEQGKLDGDANGAAASTAGRRAMHVPIEGVERVGGTAKAGFSGTHTDRCSLREAAVGSVQVWVKGGLVWRALIRRCVAAATVQSMVRVNCVLP